MTGPGVPPPEDPRPEAATLVDDGPDVRVDAPPFGGGVDAPAEAPVDPDEPVVIEDDPVVVTDEADDLDGFDAFDGFDGAGEPGASVDPRMARRWVDQRRNEGRRRLRILLGVAAFASVALLAWVVAHSSLLGMDTVEVHGTSRVDAASVRTAAAIDDGAPLLFLDEAAVAQRVEQLPAVASARVHTELPNTVVIDIVERRPVAWANAPAPDSTALLDASGLVFARVAEPPAGLLRLDGVTAGAVGTSVRHADSLRRIGRLPVALRLMTDHFALTGAGGAALVLRTGQAADRIVLGDGAQTAHKGTVALALLADLTARHEHRALVNVTVPDAPFVR